MSSNQSHEYEEEKLVDETEQKVHLPPYPEPLLEIPEDLKKLFVYDGDMKDIPLRLKHKLMMMWIMWGALRNDQELIQIVNTEHDKGSDIYKVCSRVVNVLDQMARILSCTDIMEEFRG
jgi:hypothetical protein